MNKIIVSTRIKALLTLIALFIFQISHAQSDEEMKAWREYMNPGPVHQLMAMYSGEWEAEIKMWPFADAEPIESKGTMKVSMLMDGRYQLSDYSGEIMGEPMLGKSLLAYDNTLKEFISTWIDNFGTGMLILKGKYDKKAHKIDFKGEMVNPVNGKMIQVREELYFIDENSQKMLMYYNENGTDYRSMEIFYKKVN